MINKDLISELSGENIDELLKYTPEYSEQNLENIKNLTFEKLNNKEKPILKKTNFRRKTVSVIAAVLVITTLVAGVAVAAGPAIIENISRIIFVPTPTHVIEDTQRDINFSLELIDWNYEPQEHHISLEDAAKIAAEAIYNEFDFCLDGMVGYVTFAVGANEMWSGFIVSEELTRHPETSGAELFHFLIDANTGAILDLAMNTPETPFLG
ncbi:MAG: hypothetical protein FWB75_00680 [Oscillospiraceae bacterium]|nr:hypothetical protein [Oscillospiraceae bacterium]